MKLNSIQIFWLSLVTAVGSALVLLLLAVVAYPQIDLWVSGWFFKPGRGFYLADAPCLVAIHDLAYYGARVLGGTLVIALILPALQNWTGINRKGLAFLLLGLVLAPGLIGNALLKDHWGRSRPRDVSEFGGPKAFSPALAPQPDAHSNGSFVNGDASFGFYLPSVAYVVPRRRSRLFLWAGMSLALCFGLARILMGAHFLSDTLFAAVIMTAATAALHATMFGARSTRNYWKLWLDPKTT